MDSIAKEAALHWGPRARAAVPDLDIATRRWRPGPPPFRPVVLEVHRWLAEAEGSELVPLAAIAAGSRTASPRSS